MAESENWSFGVLSSAAAQAAALQEAHVRLALAAEGSEYPLDRLLALSRQTVWSPWQLLGARTDLYRVSLDQFEDLARGDPQRLEAALRWAQIAAEQQRPTAQDVAALFAKVARPIAPRCENS